MTVKLGGLVATEYHDQTDIKVSDFVDGRFTLGLWLVPGFRVDLVQIRNAANMPGAAVMVGDGSEAARFGSAVVSGDVWQDMASPGAGRIVLERLHPVVRVDDVDEEAARFGSFDLRFYGYRVD